MFFYYSCKLGSYLSENRLDSSRCCCFSDFRDRLRTFAYPTPRGWSPIPEKQIVRMQISRKQEERWKSILSVFNKFRRGDKFTRWGAFFSINKIFVRVLKAKNDQIQPNHVNKFWQKYYFLDSFACIKQGSKSVERWSGFWAERSGGSGADRSNSAPLHLFFDTPLHRSAPLHVNFWTHSGFCTLYFSKRCLNTVRERQE